MTDPKGSHRREFLKASTAAAAGLGFLPNVHAKGNDVIKVGLVGCGGRGTGAADNICEAAGTTYNIKIHALGDIFEDHLRNCRDAIKNSGHGRDKFDVSDERCFVGFDAYKKVIECCDLVMLATPPGFRPLHIEAVVKAGKNLFTEKPVGVDPTGIRKVLAAYEEAKEKKLSVVAGTQRRHDAGYIEGIKRIHEGAIGEITSGNVYWNGGGIWAHKRRPGWSDTQYQLRNWYHFVWLCGDHIVEQHVHNLDVMNWVLGTHPIRAVSGLGGRQARTSQREGHIYDHFAVEFEYPGGITVFSQCRQINGCDNIVGEAVIGTKGTSNCADRIEPKGRTGRWRFRGQSQSPYHQEHQDLIASILAGKPINEARTVAESTLTGIIGREAVYSGHAITWDEAFKSKHKLGPAEYTFGPIAIPPVAMPGQYRFA
jgi:predicted dehydrogenase